MKKQLLQFKFVSLLSIFVFCFAAQALAQGSLSGTVTDQESGETLIGVNILIDELNLGDATDAEGYFEFNNVPAGTYELEARYVGYVTVSETVTIQDGQETVLNIEMAVSTAELDEAIVTAFGIERDRRAVGYSVQDIDSDNITRAGSGDLLGLCRARFPGFKSPEVVVEPDKVHKFLFADLHPWTPVLITNRSL